jgi:CelD/BcsL family acetyltransferase involved in cellulose biosynthesis
MPRQELTVDEILAILPKTPVRITSATRGLTEAQLRAAPAPGEWSVSENLAHLRAAHDILGASILRILAEDRPAWRRMSPREWMRKTDYPTWEFAAALAAFREQRAELLTVVQSLPREVWDRYAIVTSPDKQVTNRSARFYGDWLASHEVEHLDQIEATVRAVARPA